MTSECNTSRGGASIGDAKAKIQRANEYAGTRLRAARLQRGLSQEALAAAVGLTFQQVQKYEKGKNRMSAGLLAFFAEHLKVPMTWFFDGLPQATGDDLVGASAINSMIATPGGIDVARSFTRIGVGDRQVVVRVMNALAQNGASAPHGD
ncbi:helix-turn-helix transcriptional regulator [Rhodopseudomonas sp. BR0C11]|uniref:helix-turn-helix domain-containing protein n=1 Tax=Rhodopseudomonas sp. BR0C11 TaxID=2269370 RepID=UPI0013E0BA9A|nr:helix-turn-helix transcriptional regulator [Rhodopseudomonas sp. BR0C11]NEV75520.1 helix-turn-helix transcriptional regulator [Rhodopseudomonas sp. BR0C11]